ncbi:hypothetical protein N5K27_22425 [Pigmentiphaga sp. GD03639]|uniref:hypothetical protein n=1 Tax=Pigmentiphaga sp. GD03639 TaxID=2975354 RepID=UPI0024472135|nr:hypothetical protein [Pigmentiphaga sp. GD03639]MDH2239068.1 hypothetical protein [Pigmentiphaga sp. GD03639]
MVHRTFDAAFVNRVMNDPVVRPFIGPGPDILEMGPFVADRRNVVLATEHGCFLFHWYAPGVYEVHTQFLPAGRGRHALDAAVAAAHWMFVRTDCMEMLTKVAHSNRSAAWLAERVGFRPAFERECEGYGQTTYYHFLYQDWAARAPGVHERGEWFHDRLQDLRGTPADHGQDAAHDRYVGIATEMILAGNVAKGVVLYNRWARFAGYHPISVAQESPLVLDIGDGLIRVTDNDFLIQE